MAQQYTVYKKLIIKHTGAESEDMGKDIPCKWKWMEAAVAYTKQDQLWHHNFHQR